jgi:hypothetical protein
MNLRPTRLLACGLLLSTVGCASTQLTQAQLNAIETRDVDASMSETFSAASNALFDAGYTIAMSDRQGGLLTGKKSQDKTSERIWVSPYIKDTEFTISMQVREIGPKRCAVRVKTAINGEQQVDQKAVDQIWTLMQRQVLMKEPLSDMAANGGAKSSPSPAAGK